MILHPDLFPFQKIGAEWLSKLEPNGVLADEMGLGKTPQAIAGADLVGAQDILVLCPGIARDNWEREFNRWQMLPRSVGIVQSGQKPVPKTQVIVASYTIIQNRAVLKALLDRHWDLLICDEGHLLKNHSALTTQVVYSANCDRHYGLASKAARVWVLTGTLCPNGSPSEVWTHASALFPKAAAGLESYSRWVDHFCKYKSNTFGGQKMLSAVNVPELLDRIRPFVLRREVKDVIPDLPPMRFGHVVVSPASIPKMSEQAQEADLILRAAIASHKSNPSLEEIAAVVDAEKMHIASLLRWTGVAKAPAVAEAIRTDLENGLKKVVIFARHTEVFHILETKVPGLVSITGRTPIAKRQQIIDAFQGNVADNGPPALALHLDIASTALNLTAADNVVFAETGWVPKDILQAAKRCHRIGQTRPVLARLFSLKNSLDEIVNATIARKYRMVTKIESKLK